MQNAYHVSFIFMSFFQLNSNKCHISHATKNAIIPTVYSKTPGCQNVVSQERQRISTVPERYVQAPTRAILDRHVHRAHMRVAQLTGTRVTSLHRYNPGFSVPSPNPFLCHWFSDILILDSKISTILIKGVYYFTKKRGVKSGENVFSKDRMYLGIFGSRPNSFPRRA